MTDHEPSCASGSADLEREAEREALIKKQEVLSWAIERAADQRRAEHEASLPKPTPTPARRSTAEANMTEAWRDYIDKRDRATMRAIAHAIGETIGKDIVALEKRCAALEAEIA